VALDLPTPLGDPSDAAYAVNPAEGIDPAQPPPIPRGALEVLGASPSSWRDMLTEGHPPFINRCLTPVEWDTYVDAYQFGTLALRRMR
jgi:hypothetical protein